MVMNDTLQLMHSFITSAAEQDIPLVFKGSVVLDTMLKSEGLSGLSKGTRDIDGDLRIAENVTNDKLERDIRRVISDMKDPELSVTTKRELKPGQTVSFEVSKDGTGIFSVDVGCDATRGTSVYVNAEAVEFIGVSKESMVADKAQTVSSQLVFRRIKDLFDLYALSCLPYKWEAVCQEVKNRGREFGDFSDFINHAEDIVHAYDKFKGIENKPPFEEVYLRVRDFLHLFIKGAGNICADWSPTDRVWYLNN